MNNLIFFFYSLVLLVSSFFFGHEFGMAEGAKYQREIDSQKIVAFSYEANKRLQRCQKIITSRR